VIGLFGVTVAGEGSPVNQRKHMMFLDRLPAAGKWFEGLYSQIDRWFHA
jgi:hypothetical protein